MYNNNFNNYNRYGYQQPLYPQQPNYQQQGYQQPMSINDMPIQSIRFMNETEAKAYIVTPMGKELLVDKEKGIAYLKSANNMGQSSCRIFRFEETNEEKPKPVDPSIFLTKDESMNFASKKDFEALEEKIEGLRSLMKSKLVV